MIKAIIFDCFGVLYVDSGHQFYSQLVERYPAIGRDLHDLHKRYDRGWLNFADYCAEIAALANLDADYVRQNIHGKMQLNQALLDYSQSLRPQYLIGLLSNIGAGAIDEFFDRQQRELLFDAVVLSSEVGLAKPDPAIYHLTAERLGVGPDQCLMIDDADSNCDGARSAGMTALIYTDSQPLTQVTKNITGLLT